jgi:hypothetical protein
VPVVRPWPGAETVYDTRWIHQTTADMAAAIAALDTEEKWREAGAIAKAEAMETYNPRTVFPTWYRLMTEDLPPASSVARFSLPGMP